MKNFNDDDVSNAIREIMEKGSLEDFVIEADFIPEGSENNPNNSLTEEELQQGGVLFKFRINKEKVHKYMEEQAAAIVVDITNSDNELVSKEQEN